MRSLLFLLFLLLSTFSCKHQGIKFDPDFYVGDYVNQGLVNEDGVYVMATDPTFDDFACLSRDKTIELMKILRRSNVDKKLKRKGLRILEIPNKISKGIGH